MAGIKNHLHRILHIADPSDRTTRIINGALFTLIALNAIAVAIESAGASSPSLSILLDRFELFSIVIFTLEYLARVWSSNLAPRFHRPIVGRLRYMMTPLPLLDLLATLPFWIAAAGVDLRFLRITRFFRLLKFARFARYSRAMGLISRAVSSRRDELLMAAFLMFIVLLMASTLMYYAEYEAQPKIFSSIPASLWWGVVTFTTVGYGDIYPITTAGKVIGALFGIIGISVFALPTAILTAALIDQMQTRKD